MGSEKRVERASTLNWLTSTDSYHGLHAFIRLPRVVACDRRRSTKGAHPSSYSLSRQMPSAFSAPYTLLSIVVANLAEETSAVAPLSAEIIDSNRRSLEFRASLPFK